MTEKHNKQIIPLLREAVNSFATHPIILLPFITTAFVQLLILEGIYFTARFPLVNFFGPIIRRLEGEIYLHYPNHLFIVPKWFGVAQYILFIFVSCFLVGTSMEIIKSINNNQKITFGKAIKNLLPQYVHIWIAAIIMFLTFYGLKHAQGLLVARALQIRSESGLFFLIKAAIIYGAPYLNLFISVFATALFAFVIPIIVIERRKVFLAFILNFKHLWGSFWFVLAITLIPALLYVPVLFLESNLPHLVNIPLESVRLIPVILSIVIFVVIDATVYTAITTYFLLKNENA